MKNKIITCVVGLGLFLGGLKAQQTLTILHVDQLIKISANEWVDPSRISYFKHSYTVDLSSIGGDKNYPIDARLIVDGAVVAPTAEAEENITKVLNK